MAFRMRRPETVRLKLNEEHWLEVKKHLTAGERRAMLSRLVLDTDTGELKVNPIKVGLSKILAYVVDWSIQDAEGQPVVIRYQPVETLEAALDGLDADDFSAILAAVDAHDAAMEVAREAEKNVPAIAS